MISSFRTVRHLPGFREFIISFEDPPWVGYFSIEETMTLPLQPWYHGITIKPGQGNVPLTEFTDCKKECLFGGMFSG